MLVRISKELRQSTSVPQTYLHDQTISFKLLTKQKGLEKKTLAKPFSSVASRCFSEGFFEGGSQLLVRCHGFLVSQPWWFLFLLLMGLKVPFATRREHPKVPNLQNMKPHILPQDLSIYPSANDAPIPSHKNIHESRTTLATLTTSEASAPLGWAHLPIWPKQHRQRRSHGWVPCSNSPTRS